MEKLGTEYGGWVVPAQMNLNENSIVYSGGVGEDMSFDFLLQSKYGCYILLIDPTSKALTHYIESQSYYNNRKLFTGNIQGSYYDSIQHATPNFNKFAYANIGLWYKKDKLKFFKQHNQSYVSQSLIANMFGNDYDIVSVDSVRNIMIQYGHTHIDLMKLDIEGAEVEVVNKMLDDNIHPTYLLIEFDLLLKNKDPLHTTRQLIERLITRERYTQLAFDNLNITFKHNPV